MNAIITSPDDGGGALSVEHIKRQVQTVQQVMRDVMIEGEHYGTVPGCGPKKALMKSGAEKLCFTFQLVPAFDVIHTDLAGGHREYFVKCRLSNRAGQLIAEGVGTCSTMESKYRYRNAARACPECGATAIIKGKADYGGGWLCFAKKGGCGAKWDDGAAVIEKQETGKAENPDPADVFNTCLKMAKKRAHVDATITATAASDIFAQDIDENLEKEDAARAQAQAAQQPAPEAARPTPAAAAPKPAAATTTAAPPKSAPATNGTKPLQTSAPGAATADAKPAATTIGTPSGIGKSECDALAIALKAELKPLNLEAIAGMCWWGDCASQESRHATLTQAITHVQHYRKAVGDAKAAEMLEDLAAEYGYPAAARSHSIENRARCAEFLVALRQGANGETPTGVAATTGATP